MRKPDSPDGSEDTPQPTPAPQWRKAKKPMLLPSTTADDALAEIVTRGVDHLRANEACVLARAHEEGVHQMRVAARRLRSSLALYRPYIPDEQRRYLNSELRWLITEMGPARDWDIFVDETLGPVIGHVTDNEALALLHEAAEKQRDKAYVRAQAALKTQRYLGLTMLLGAWAKGHRWHDGDVPMERRRQLNRPATELARHLLDELCDTVKQAGADFESLSAEERHSLRIQIKKLRYGIEFFETLFRKNQAATYLATVKTLQETLGVDNDIFVARQLIKTLVKAVPNRKASAFDYATGLIIGWHTHIASEREKRTMSSWDRFVNATPFWHEATAAAAQATDDEETIDPFGTLVDS